MNLLNELLLLYKNIKCPVCNSKLILASNNLESMIHFLDENDNPIYNAETWCKDDHDHYRMAFEYSNDNNIWELILENLLLFDDNYEFTIERSMLPGTPNKITIITKNIYENEDDSIFDIQDIGSSLRDLNLQKLYSLLTFS